MIAAAHQKLRGWIAALAGDGIAISMSLPSQREDGAGVSLYLMEMARPVVTHQERNQRLQLTLRYLVTAWSAQTDEAHELLEKMMLIAAETSDLQIEAEPPSLPLWRALGISPRPAFILRYAVQQDRLERTAPVVKTAPVIVSAPLNRSAAEAMKLPRPTAVGGGAGEKPPAPVGSR